MDSKATIIPLGKIYKNFYSAPPHEKSRAEPYYEEHHEIQEITDYGVPESAGPQHVGNGEDERMRFATCSSH